MPHLFAVTIGDHCFNKEPYEMSPSEVTSYILMWRGTDPGLTGCTYRFKIRDSQHDIKEYEVCVETEEFFMQSIGIHVKFSSNSFSRSDLEVMELISF